MYLLPDSLSILGTYFRDYSLMLGSGATLRCFDIKQSECTLDVNPIGSRKRLAILIGEIDAIIDNGTGEVLTSQDDTYLSDGAEVHLRRLKGRTRKSDNAVLEKLFRFQIIRHFYRFRLIEEFGFRCFNCSESARLIEIPEELSHTSGGLLRFANIAVDHHLPFELGGSLEYGNLVPLCNICNSKKSNLDPRVFYGEQELAFLAEKLNDQREQFDFHLDWDYLNERKFREYFEKIGIPSHLIDHALTSEDHYYYIF